MQAIVIFCSEWCLAPSHHAKAKYATMESAQVNAKDSAQMAATPMVSEATLAWHISCLGCQCKDCQQFVWRTERKQQEF